MDGRASSFILLPNNNSATDDQNNNKYFENIKLSTFDWSAADFTKINDAIHRVDWHTPFCYNFVANSLWEGLKSILWPIISLYVPNKLINCFKKYKPQQYPI